VLIKLVSDCVSIVVICRVGREYGAQQPCVPSAWHRARRVRDTIMHKQRSFMGKCRCYVCGECVCVQRNSIDDAMANIYKFSAPVLCSTQDRLQYDDFIECERRCHVDSTKRTPKVNGDCTNRCVESEY